MTLGNPSKGGIPKGPHAPEEKARRSHPMARFFRTLSLYARNNQPSLATGSGKQRKHCRPLTPQATWHARKNQSTGCDNAGNPRFALRSARLGAPAIAPKHESPDHGRIGFPGFPERARKHKATPETPSPRDWSDCFRNQPACTRPKFAHDPHRSGRLAKGARHQADPVDPQGSTGPRAMRNTSGFRRPGAATGRDPGSCRKTRCHLRASGRDSARASPQAPRPPACDRSHRPSKRPPAQARANVACDSAPQQSDHRKKDPDTSRADYPQNRVRRPCSEVSTGPPWQVVHRQAISPWPWAPSTPPTPVDPTGACAARSRANPAAGRRLGRGVSPSGCALPFQQALQRVSVFSSQEMSLQIGAVSSTLRP